MGSTMGKGETAQATSAMEPKSKAKVTKRGNVYVSTDARGGESYMPAKHYEANVVLEFGTEAEAEKANAMSAEEAMRFYQESRKKKDGQTASTPPVTSAMQIPGA
jgi:hypothetical protein